MKTNAHELASLVLPILDCIALEAYDWTLVVLPPWHVIRKGITRRWHWIRPSWHVLRTMICRWSRLSWWMTKSLPRRWSWSFSFIASFLTTLLLMLIQKHIEGHRRCRCRWCSPLPAASHLATTDCAFARTPPNRRDERERETRSKREEARKDERQERDRDKDSVILTHIGWRVSLDRLGSAWIGAGFF